MRDVVTAIGLILALEGALYALFSDAMRRMAKQVLHAPGDTLRVVGVISPRSASRSSGSYAVEAIVKRTCRAIAGF